MRPPLPALLAASLLPLRGLAVDAPVRSLQSPEREQSVFVIQDENDWWGKWSDKYYTNGSRLAWTSPEIFGDSDDSDVFRATLSLTSEMYSPKNGAAMDPSPEDHPYAGLTYAGIGLSRETATTLDSVQLDLGVIGESALAERLQQNWHHLINTPTLNGWDTQLRDEPLVNITLERRWRIRLAGDGRDGVGADLLPRVAAIVGTARTEAAVGCQFRFGLNPPADFGHGFIRQNTAYSKPRAAQAPASVYAFLDLQAEAVARSVALDGNLWKDSRSVGSRPVVGQLSLGVALATGRWRLLLTQNIRTEEFDGQDRAFVFGGLTASADF